MDNRLKLALIYGSARPGRFCDTVARWAAARIEAHGGFALDLIDPALLDLPVHGGGPAVATLRKQIAQADAFVVVTPEYNHGYPAALKLLIDSAHEEWHAKPVAFVSYGGVSGGLRAVEQLRQVFAELHAPTVRNTVSFANAGEAFSPDGQPLARERSARSMAAMPDQLRWWATALSRAREAAPYARVA